MNTNTTLCPVSLDRNGYEICSINDTYACKLQEEIDLNATLGEQHQHPCYKMAELTDPIYPAVLLLNTSQLVGHLTNNTSGVCSLVLFYAVWCPFSMQLAPAYNALGRLFPTVPVVAIDIKMQFNVLANSQLKFGTTSVPNLLVFDGVRAIARYNKSEADLPSLVRFLETSLKLPALEHKECVGTNSTIQECTSAYTVTESDRTGPMPVEFVDGHDWLLGVSLIILGLIAYDKCRR